MMQKLTADDVAAIREQSGLGWAAFGAALGVSERAVRGWAKGALIPDAQQQLLRAARAVLIGGEALAFWARDFAAQLRGQGGQ